MTPRPPANKTPAKGALPTGAKVRGATRQVAKAQPVAAPSPSGTKRLQGAQQQTPSLRSQGQGYLQHHRRVARESLLRLLQTPLATFMTLAVIAIALTLPAVLQVGLINAQALTGDWQGGAKMSLFLQRTVSDAEAEDLARQLVDNEQIARVDYLSPQGALEEFQGLSGFGDALQVLDSNPLPGVLLVEPAEGYLTPAKLAALQQLLSAVDGVASADLDLGWIQRLQAILALVQRVLVAVALLLGATVLLVVGNTIRLAIENRREEILVAKLVGATDAFVRRPFLYTGAWYGLGGGLLALGLAGLCLGYLEGPLVRLLGLYGSSQLVQGLDWMTGGGILFGSLLLGVVGGWLAVGRHLRAIAPG